MALINQDDLKMAGLGVATASATLPVGVHLRWSFDPATRGPQSDGGGFVLPGFNLYRRAHDAANGVGVDTAAEGTVPSSGAFVTFTGASGLVYALPHAGLTIGLPAALDAVLAANTGATHVVLPGPTWKAELTVDISASGGFVRLTALDGSQAVRVAEITGVVSNGVVGVIADRFDAIAIELLDATVSEIRYVEIETSINLASWTLIAGPLAPVSSWATTSARMLAAEVAQLDGPSGAPWTASYLPTVDDLFAGLPGQVPLLSGSDPLPPSTAITIPPVQRLLLASMDPAIARAVGLLHIDDTVTPGDYYDYLLRGDYADNTFYWICHRLGTTSTLPLPDPTDLVATASRGPQSIAVDTGDPRSGGRVHLRWTPPLDGTRLKSGAPVRYAVQYQALGTGASPDAIDPGAWADAFDGVFAMVLPQRSDGSLHPGLGVAHAPLDPAWYGYQVQGMDIFGRTTAFLGPETARVPRDPDPPPPATVEARYLSEEVSDLTTAEAAWVATNTSGVRMRWLWSREHARQAPGVVEFRVYGRAAAPKRRLGTISGVTDGGNGTAVVATDINLAAAPGGFVDGWLTSSGVRFKVLSHSSTATSTFIVAQNKALNPATGKNEPVLPAAGSATVTESLRSPLRWDDRVYAQANDLSAVSTSVSSVTLVVDGVYDIECDAVALVGSDHAGPGLLYNDDEGTRMWAASHTVDGTGDLTTIRVRVATDAAGTPEGLPSVGDALTYYPAYDVLVPDVAIAVTAVDGVATCRFGVSSADDDAAVSDAARWASGSYGGRDGNEGSVSAPAVAHAVWTTAPDAPSVVALTNNLASNADFNGQSRVAVAWPAVSGQSFHLLRATAEAILAEYVRSTAPETSPEEYDPAAILAMSAPGSMDSYFTPVNKERIGAEYVSGTVVEYTDTLPGAGSNRFLYRVIAEDGAGNRGAASLVPTIVYIPIPPPQTPRIVRTLAGDGTVTVEWQRVREAQWLSGAFSAFPAHRPRLVGYRVYRATSAADAEDVRLMTLVTTVTPTYGNRTESYADTDVETATTYYYRVTAVTQRTLTGTDEERESVASSVTSGACYSLALPEDPTWVSATAGEEGVVLLWSATDARLRCLVQRTVPGFDDIWISLGTWLDAGVLTATDASAVAGNSYTYRLRARNAVGIERVGTTTTSVTP